MKTKAAVIGLVLGLSSITAHANDHNHYQHKSDADINIMQPSSWFKDMPKAGYTMEFNFAHPAGLAGAISPKTHTAWHMALMNPATYAQFMTPDFWLQFANPKNIIAWMNPMSYKTFFDPNTYAYWMTPHAYVHALNPEGYKPLIDPSAYAKLFDVNIMLAWFKPSTYDIAKVTADPKAIDTASTEKDYVGEVMAYFTAK